MRLDEKIVDCAIDGDDMPMIEATDVPEVYCDGIAAAEALGTENVRVTYYTRRRVRGHDAKVPVLQMVRPRRSCGAQIERLLAQADGARRRGH